MTRVTSHLVRGATAAVLLAWAAVFGQTQPVLAVAAAGLAVIAMRGCPACWLLGLYDKVTRPS